jgi:ParB-like chromosome segregation protein Spo0J
MAELVHTTNETRKVAELTVDPQNARRHTEQQIAEIANSIQRFSYAAPVIIQPSGQLIGGHATVLALKRLERDEVDVRVVHGLTDAGYAALGLALNKIPENSRWDEGVMRDVLASIDAGGEDITGLGFSSNELTKLLEEPAELELKEIETSDVEDEFWISVRGPLAEQANALKALREAMAPFSGVKVEQGTIAIG